eukprot:TRINITY_DN25318_c0_g1_i1.p1 TRINITY_DN25318_c0_g1~~TRINITY_DN25318_c0_g1_i1.p1  ORF type:complete len:259 (-),score=41.12 TRINITY_DN25318_c0_g1_i1:8-784(-)
MIVLVLLCTIFAQLAGAIVYNVSGTHVVGDLAVSSVSFADSTSVDTAPPTAEEVTALIQAAVTQAKDEMTESLIPVRMNLEMTLASSTPSVAFDGWTLATGGGSCTAVQHQVIDRNALPGAETEGYKLLAYMNRIATHHIQSFAIYDITCTATSNLYPGPWARIPTFGQAKMTFGMFFKKLSGDIRGSFADDAVLDEWVLALAKYSGQENGYDHIHARMDAGQSAHYLVALPAVVYGDFNPSPFDWWFFPSSSERYAL